MKLFRISGLYSDNYNYNLEEFKTISETKKFAIVNKEIFEINEVRKSVIGFNTAYLVYNSSDNKKVPKIPLTIDMLDDDFKTLFLEKNTVYDKSIFVVSYYHHIYENIKSKCGVKAYAKNELHQEFQFDSNDKAFLKLNDLYDYSCNKIVELEQKTIAEIKEENGMVRISKLNHHSDATFIVNGHGFGTPRVYISFGEEFKKYPMYNYFKGRISEIVAE